MWTKPPCSNLWEKQAEKTGICTHVRKNVISDAICSQEHRIFWYKQDPGNEEEECTKSASALGKLKI